MERVTVSPAAEGDALEIWVYIARDNPGAADRLLDRLDAMFSELAEQPGLGKRVDELFPTMRMFPVGNYLIFCRLSTNGIEIARLLRAARDISADLFRE